MLGVSSGISNPINAILGFIAIDNFLIFTDHWRRHACRLYKNIYMSELFNNKYRIPSTRLQSWNYANEGMYFVTICAKDKEHYLGDISESLLIPTELGKVAWSEWFNTIQMRPDMNIELSEFVVMPNHIHGIIIIGKNQFNNSKINTTGAAQNQFIYQSKNLASVIRGYKSAVTMFAEETILNLIGKPVFMNILSVQWTIIVRLLII